MSGSKIGSHLDQGNHGCQACGADRPRATSGPAGRVFEVSGMDCAEEIDALRRGFGPLVGDRALLSFDLLGGRVMIAADPTAVTDAMIVAAVARAGLGDRSFLLYG